MSLFEKIKNIVTPFVNDKKNKPVIILSCSLLVVFFVISISFIISPNKLNKRPNGVNIHNIPIKGGQSTLDNRITYAELSKSLKVIFFDNSVSSDRVLESTSMTNHKPVHYIYVSLDSDVIDTVRVQLVYDLSRKGFNRLYTDDSNHIVTESTSNMDIDSQLDPQRDFRLEILLEEMIPIPRRDNINPVSPIDPIKPSRTQKGQIALLIDDGGANYNLADRLTKMNIPITLSILPHLQYSSQTANLTRSRGKSVFLHFPMEPISYPNTDPGEGAALVNMPKILLDEVTRFNIENLGAIDGTNNHMGSAFTSNREKMTQILDSLKPYTDTFVDSNTIADSVAYTVCKETSFKCGLNKKFIDNDNNHEYIRAKLYEAAQIASTQGEIIAIGHLRHDTVDVLERVVPELQELGYTFVTVKSLTQ